MSNLRQEGVGSVVDAVCFVHDWSKKRGNELPLFDVQNCSLDNDGKMPSLGSFSWSRHFV